MSPVRGCTVGTITPAPQLTHLIADDMIADDMIAAASHAQMAWTGVRSATCGGVRRWPLGWWPHVPALAQPSPDHTGSPDHSGRPKKTSRSGLPDAPPCPLLVDGRFASQFSTEQRVTQETLPHAPRGPMRALLLLSLLLAPLLVSGAIVTPYCGVSLSACAGEAGAAGPGCDRRGLAAWATAGCPGQQHVNEVAGNYICRAPASRPRRRRAAAPPRCTASPFIHYAGLLNQPQDKPLHRVQWQKVLLLQLPQLAYLDWHVDRSGSERGEALTA